MTEKPSNEDKWMEDIINKIPTFTVVFTQDTDELGNVKTETIEHRKMYRKEELIKALKLADTHFAKREKGIKEHFKKERQNMYETLTNKMKEQNCEISRLKLRICEMCEYYQPDGCHAKPNNNCPQELKKEEKP